MSRTPHRTRTAALIRRASGAVAAVALSAGALATVGLGSTAAPAGASAGPVGLTFLGRYTSGNPDGGSEISAFDPATERLFVTNGVTEKVDIVDISNPTGPVKFGEISVGHPIQSVAVHGNLVAVAAEGSTRQSPGTVYVADTDGTPLWDVTVGSLPDMVTFTADGSKILTANEGEPLNYCAAGTANDPEGSISVVDVATHVATTAGFGAWTDADALRAQGIRIFGPNATVSQDLEPEYIAITADDATAFVTLQENNALARVDIATATVTDLLPLGYQDHNVVPIDTSDRDGPGGSAPNRTKVNIVTRPHVQGMYLPDGIDAFESGGTQYIVTANEGDAREYGCFAGGTSPAVLQREDLRVSEQVGLDDTVFSDLTEDTNANLRRLRASSVFPLTAADKSGTGLKKVYSYGTRSFTIRSVDGSIVWDSGAELEQRTATAFPSQFNGDWDSATGSFNGADVPAESRSAAKGPEPESVTVGWAYGRQYAFVGLERIGGVMVYDVTDPTAPTFVQYVNTSVWAGNYKAGTAGDVAPEGVLFVPGTDSPTGKPLVIVSYELSGTTAVFELNGPPTIVAAPDTTVAENVGTTTIDVTLDEDSSQTVSVDYEVVAATATAGDDFVVGAGRLTFAPGDTTEPITVAVVNDTTDEPAETLTVVLDNPTNGLLGDAESAVTITDDDRPEVRIADASVAEGNGGSSKLAFAVTLTSPAAETVQFSVRLKDGTARQGSDYGDETGRVTVNAGETSKTVVVVVKGDRRREADETFTVELRARRGTAAVQLVDLVAIGTIVNDD